MFNLDMLNELREAYIAGFSNHLEEMESILISLEKNTGEYKENYESLYRKAHNLKGSGGTNGFYIITNICHQFEDFISESLSVESAISPEATDIAFSYLDLLKETHGLIEEETTDFSPIVVKLEKIKSTESGSRLRCLFVGESNHVYGKMCQQVLIDNNVKFSTSDNGMTALQRLIHEQFDFLITSKENADLNGMAIIAALQYSNGSNRHIRTILMTSDAQVGFGGDVKPDFIVLKNREFAENLERALDKIGKEVAAPLGMCANS